MQQSSHGSGETVGPGGVGPGSTQAHGVGGGGAYYYYYLPSPVPPRVSSLKHAGQTAYIYPSRRTSKRWSSSFNKPTKHSTTTTPNLTTPSSSSNIGQALRAPEYVLINSGLPSASTTKQSTGGTTTPAFTREWETDNESGTAGAYSNKRNRISTGFSNGRTTTYAQRLRKKGKRVRFIPQPTAVIPIYPESQSSSSSEGSGKSSSSKKRGRSRSPSPGETMGSAASKQLGASSFFIPSSSTRSRHRKSGNSSGGGGYNHQYHQSHLVTDPYSSSQRGHKDRSRSKSGRHRESSSSSSAAAAAAAAGGYTYTYTYPQYPQHNQYSAHYYPQAGPTAAPESAYFLGTETFPALHSLGKRPSPDSEDSTPPASANASASAGKVKSSSKRSGSKHRSGHSHHHHHSGGSGSGANYYQEQIPPVYKHHHRGTSYAPPEQQVGGMYVIGQDGKYYWYPAGGSGGGSSSGGKRGREHGSGGSSGREKKLRRAKGVDDMRGRSLRGGGRGGVGDPHAYGGGWVSVGA